MRLAAAASAGARAAHVGFFLIDDGRRALERAVGARRSLAVRLGQVGPRARFAGYVGAIVALTLFVSAGLARAAPLRGVGPWALAAAILVFSLGASQLAVAVVNWAATLLVRPLVLPRLDFAAGIPPEHKTVVAVPTLLTDPQEIDGLIEALEVRYLANRDHHLAFALLTDFKDAPSEKMAGDEALLAQAVAGIAALNARYGAPTGAFEAAPFYLFHRPRRLNRPEGVWMGWERKRGKLEQFNEALGGQLDHFETTVGDVARLRDVKYVIVLDSDTQLPRDSARELVGTIAHWLNRPRYDEARGRVTEGYSILQPRVAITMASSSRSLFARLFAGDPGIDPYTRAVSDVYQDLFGEGSFIGKGIYDVEAFRRSLTGRFPENRILSHDLLEGAHARSGLVSDITLFEDHPSTYAADVSRRYRWMRGDWQITSWLVGRVPGARGERCKNPISLLSRWKILDNLRRALVPVALVILLLAAWWIPGAGRFGVLAVAGILLLPGLLAAAGALVRRPDDFPYAQHAREVGRTLGRQVLREVFALACLPYEAYVALSAVARTEFRLLVSRRRLLEWRTARDAQRSARAGLGGTYVEMWTSPVVAAVAAAILATRAPWSLAGAAPVLALWLLSPALSWWLGQPVAPARPELSAEDRAFLRVLARKTWRFFETFVDAGDNHLPPDNFQEDPPRGIAHRTSPTNIGLALTANLAAYDFRLPVGLRGDRADDADAGVDGQAAAVSRPFLQLVRHADARAAAAALRVDRRQRQPHGPPHHARERPRRAGRAPVVSRGALPWLARHARDARRAPAEDRRLRQGPRRPRAGARPPVEPASNAAGVPAAAANAHRGRRWPRALPHGAARARAGAVLLDGRLRLSLPVGERGAGARRALARARREATGGARAARAARRARRDAHALGRRAARPDARAAARGDPRGDQGGGAVARGGVLVRAPSRRGRRGLDAAPPGSCRSLVSSSSAAGSSASSTSSSCTIAAGTSSRSATTWPTTGSTAASTICWPPRRAWPASWPSRKASFRRSTGSAWDAR